MTRSARSDGVLSLELRLQAIADNIPTSLIDELWVFPPLPNRDLACEFLVLVCYDGGPQRRRILTAHVDTQRSDPESDDFEWVQRLREHGTAPQDWVAGMPDRLLQRLSEAGVPEVIEVGGRLETWEEAVRRFANGSGNGKGKGEPAVSGPARVDSSLSPVIAFSTINETELSTAVSDNGAYTESE
ncbi:MAG: hypothetical protein V3U13_03320 [Gemmatimonadota bacterium]